MMQRVLFIPLLAIFAMQAHSQELAFPIKPEPTAQNTHPAASARIATGPWNGENLPGLNAEGNVTLRAWKLPNTELTTRQILDTLREGLLQDGYEIIYECDTLECGGFDFRYNIPHLPEPDMHVDLGDFRYLAARRKADTGATGKNDHKTRYEYLTLLVSRSPRDGFVQMLHVVPDGAEASGAASSPVETEAGPVAAGGKPIDASDLAQRLEGEGRVVLEDLEFATGSASLSDQEFESLRALAQYLKANPDRRVILVGHTDAEGSLAGNIALSKKRAAAVVQRLRKKYGIPSRQVTGEGMGFLAPRASNLTKEGRSLNRRVEAILASVK